MDTIRESIKRIKVNKKNRNNSKKNIERVTKHNIKNKNKDNEIEDESEMVKVSYDTLIRKGNKIDLEGISINERYVVHYADHRIIIDTHYMDIGIKRDIDFVDFIGLSNIAKFVLSSIICIYMIKINIALSGLMVAMLTIQLYQEWRKFETLFNIVSDNALWIK